MMADNERPTPEQRLAELHIELPRAATPAGLYLPVRRWKDTLYVSGHVPTDGDDAGPVIGKVGADLTLEQARDAARMTGLNLLAALRQDLGSLDRVAGILKVFGMVKCAPGFTQTPDVINGCSELLIDVFGAPGRHARSAIGVAELPFGMAVEIEMIAVAR
jgi:enamine deaminase RidA (YjgF/YER057c/UK114 family)